MGMGGETGVALTVGATKRIAELLAGEEPGAVFRVSVEGGGCSGFQYQFAIAPAPEAEDSMIERDGARILIDTIDVTDEIVVPAGTQSGTVVAIKGRGVPRLNGRGRGRHLVVLEVHIPDDLSEAEQDLYRQLAELRNEKVVVDQGLTSWIKDTLRR